MIKEIAFAGWKHNLSIQGKTTELVITLDVGPRILRYGFPGERNVFVEMAEQLGGSGEKEWMIRGGHRFWTAPEADHSYELDNAPVEWKKLGDSAVEITQPPSPYGFQKTLRVEMGDGRGRARHALAEEYRRQADRGHAVGALGHGAGRHRVHPAAAPRSSSQRISRRPRDEAGGFPAQSRNGPVALHQPHRRALHL